MSSRPGCSGSMAASTWPRRVRPHIACSTFGVADFIRRPWPAASTITAAGRASVTSTYLGYAMWSESNAPLPGFEPGTSESKSDGITNFPTAEGRGSLSHLCGARGRADQGRPPTLDAVVERAGTADTHNNAAVIVLAGVQPHRRGLVALDGGLAEAGHRHA